ADARQFDRLAKLFLRPLRSRLVRSLLLPRRRPRAEAQRRSERQATADRQRSDHLVLRATPARLTRRSGEGGASHETRPCVPEPRVYAGSVRAAPYRARVRSAFLPERVVDLLLDRFEVLPQQLFFVFRQDPERHAHDALFELHVEPVLTVRNTLRQL